MFSSPHRLILAALIVAIAFADASASVSGHDPIFLPVNSTSSVTGAGDTAWLLTSGALVSLMTPGLAFFYGGLVESTTVLNTLMMSYVCAAIVTVCFLCCFCSEVLPFSSLFYLSQIQFLVFGYSLAFSGPSSFFGDGAVVVMQNLNQDAVSNLSPNPNVPHAAFIFFELQFAYVHPHIACFFIFSPSLL